MSSFEDTQTIVTVIRTQGIFQGCGPYSHNSLPKTNNLGLGDYPISYLISKLHKFPDTWLEPRTNFSDYGLFIKSLSCLKV